MGEEIAAPPLAQKITIKNPWGKDVPGYQDGSGNRYVATTHAYLYVVCGQTTAEKEIRKRARERKIVRRRFVGPAYYVRVEDLDLIRKDLNVGKPVEIPTKDGS